LLRATDGGVMKEIILEILRFSGAVAVVVSVLYLRYKALERHVKDLGDGGIQTVLGDHKRK
jgi:hypothetical protein